MSIQVNDVAANSFCSIPAPASKRRPSARRVVCISSPNSRLHTNDPHIQLDCHVPHEFTKSCRFDFHFDFPSHHSITLGTSTVTGQTVGKRRRRHFHFLVAPTVTLKPVIDNHSGTLTIIVSLPILIFFCIGSPSAAASSMMFRLYSLALSNTSATLIF